MADLHPIIPILNDWVFFLFLVDEKCFTSTQLSVYDLETPMKRTLPSSVPYSDIPMPQPLGWSSEYRDSELDLIYYNYRHYNPQDGRWINRAPIGIQGEYHLYGVVKHNHFKIDTLGLPFVPRHKPIRSTTIKINKIKRIAIILENVFPKGDTYGYLRIGFDNESHGWRPVGTVTLGERLISVEGQLNDLINPPPTQDTNHRDNSPYVYAGNIFSTYIQYRQSKGKKCSCIKEEDIKACLRTLTKQYSGTWSNPRRQNCHSFQEVMMHMCA